MIPVLLLGTNLLAFALMGADKRRARMRRRRIPEKTLFAAAGCFGALGAVMGMFVFRHKTRHWTFRCFLPLMLAAQLALLLWAFHACGAGGFLPFS
jgi:uncharacterized membrane protein YsdA (DUF1294 family)